MMHISPQALLHTVRCLLLALRATLMVNVGVYVALLAFAAATRARAGTGQAAWLPQLWGGGHRVRTAALVGGHRDPQVVVGVVTRPDGVVIARFSSGGAGLHVLMHGAHRLIPLRPRDLVDLRPSRLPDLAHFPRLDSALLFLQALVEAPPATGAGAGGSVSPLTVERCTPAHPPTFSALRFDGVPVRGGGHVVGGGGGVTVGGGGGHVGGGGGGPAWTQRQLQEPVSLRLWVLCSGTPLLLVHSSCSLLDGLAAASSTGAAVPPADPHAPRLLASHPDSVRDFVVPAAALVEYALLVALCVTGQVCTAVTIKLIERRL